MRKKAQTRQSTGRSEERARGCVKVSNGRNAATGRESSLLTA